MRERLLADYRIDFYFERSVTKASYIEKEGYLVKHAISSYMNAHPNEKYWSDVLATVCNLHNREYVTEWDATPLSVTRNNFGSIIEALHEKQPGKWKSYYPIPAVVLEKYAPSQIFKFNLNEKVLLDISRHSQRLGKISRRCTTTTTTVGRHSFYPSLFRQRNKS